MNNNLNDAITHQIDNNIYKGIVIHRDKTTDSGVVTYTKAVNFCNAAIHNKKAHIAVIHRKDDNNGNFYLYSILK